MTAQLQPVRGEPAQGRLALDQAAAAAELDRRLDRLVRDGALSELEKELVRALWPHRGAENPLRLDVLIAVLRMPTQPADRLERSRRTVKAMVKDLIEQHHVPIGASRVPPYGYFLIISPEDLSEALRPLKSELRSLARRVRALTTEEFVARLFRQIPLELEEKDSPQSPQRAQRGAA